MAGKVLVRISMKPESTGGRGAPFAQGYSPHFVADGADTWLGVRALICAAPVAPGDTAEVTFELVYPGVDYSGLGKGVRFRVMEGAKAVGEGVVLERLEE